MLFELIIECRDGTWHLVCSANSCWEDLSGPEDLSVKPPSDMATPIDGAAELRSSDSGDKG
ncbi:MAG: hypothetical protein EXR72_07370 [Myxococcales bacterium]|nr:hypothetical protein [Myxococcales bacterium]